MKKNLKKALAVIAAIAGWEGLKVLVNVVKGMDIHYCAYCIIAMFVAVITIVVFNKKATASKRKQNIHINSSSTIMWMCSSRVTQ